MKKLEDLKTEILNNKINNFYVFYGEDFGIRKHYINKISETFGGSIYLNDYNEVSSMTVTKGLFTIKKLLVIYNDQEFLKLNDKQLATFIERLNKYTVIFDYDTLAETYIKKFDNYCTYFPEVETIIATEFIEDEVNLINKDKNNLAYNCENNYSNILLECDKIKNYAEYSNLSQQNAYENLEIQKQMIKRVDEFDCNAFMDDVLTNNRDRISYWSELITKNYNDEFWYNLNRIFIDFIIAYYIKAYGVYKCGSILYNLGLPWIRTKHLRELPIVYSKEYLLELANSVAGLDKKVKQGRIANTDVFDRFINML